MKPDENGQIFSSPEYDIVSELGQGAMGKVYKAKMGDTFVAIKVISPDVSQDKQFQRRFLREMQVISQLNHPYIVKCLDFGVDIEKDLYFVVLEFVDGKSLGERIREKKQLPLEEVMEVTKKIAAGLQYASMNNLVHRDIKPDNILLGKDGTVKIADFGLVKTRNEEEDSAMTQAGSILGTPHYVAPEQVMGEEVDIRADIYSLGITCYHMLVGHPPFNYKTFIRVLTAHCNEPIPPIQGFCPDLPIEVIQLLNHMTAKNPDERCSSPLEIVQKIHKFPKELYLDISNDETMAGNLTSTTLKAIQLMVEEGESSKYGEVLSNRPKGTEPFILIAQKSPEDTKKLHNIIAQKFPSLQIVSVSLGKEVIEVAQQHQPILIFLDFNLGDLLGIQVLEILRQSHSPLELPVFLTTSLFDSTTRGQAYMAKANDCLLKPLNLPEVTFKIDLILQAKKLFQK